MEVILLLYVREEDYGRRLLRFLLGKKNSFLHPELVTDERMLWNRAGTQTQRIVVLTDREMAVKEKSFICRHSAVMNGKVFISIRKRRVCTEN